MIVLARAGLIGIAVLVGAANAANAQDEPLGDLLGELAESWARGDAGRIVTLVAGPGVSLALEDRTIGPLAPRQAAALLRRIFDERETVELRVGMERVVGGAPPRAFGELAWTHRMRGMTVPERTTIFFALVQEEEGWRITEIRLLR